MIARANRTTTSLILGVVGVMALVGAAKAGDDDGGSKGFYDVPGAGRYSEAPQPTASAPAVNENNGATAAMNNGAYEGYKAEPAVRRHHYKHPAQAE